jgi:hypothetical protein
MGDDCAPPLAHRRLEERAIRERWPLSADGRVKILKRLVKTVDDEAVHDPLPRPGHREVIAAARALISADKLNLDYMKFEAEQKAEQAGGMEEIHELVANYLDPDDSVNADRRPERDGPDADLVSPAE